MHVESKKRFRHGFVLNEAELRRIVDLVSEQLSKLPDEGEVKTYYEMKFLNGARAVTESIDEVLGQENVGSSRIVSLKVSLSLNSKEKTTEAEIYFIDTDSDDDSGATSIKYYLSSIDRDWVFVTGSLMDERIAKIKRFAPNSVLGKGGMVFIPMILLFILVSISSFIKGIVEVDRYTLILNAIESGEVEDALDGLVFLEKLEEQGKGFLDLTAFAPLGSMAVFFGIGYLLYLFFSKYYPVFNFCWGDYTDEFKRKESVRKFFFVVVVIGVVVSFIGGVLANLI